MKRTFSFLIIFLGMFFLLSSCAPKIYGQHKKKKKKCGCEFIPVQQYFEDENVACFQTEESELLEKAPN